MHVTPCVFSRDPYVAGSGNQGMRKHISEVIIGELVCVGHTFRIGCGTDITVFSGEVSEDGPTSGLRIATVQLDKGCMTTLAVWLTGLLCLLAVFTLTARI